MNEAQMTAATFRLSFIDTCGGVGRLLPEEGVAGRRAPFARALRLPSARRYLIFIGPLPPVAEDYETKDGELIRGLQSLLDASRPVDSREKSGFRSPKRSVNTNRPTPGGAGRISGAA
jgi:hypothetical protein